MTSRRVFLFRKISRFITVLVVGRKEMFFTFLEQVMGLGFKDAVEYLAKREGLEIPKIARPKFFPAFSRESLDREKEAPRKDSI